MANLCAQCRSTLPGSTNLCPTCGFVNPIVKKGTSVLVIILVVFAVGIPMLGILSVVAVFGVRQYIVNAKTAEARNTLGQIGKAAARSFEERGRLCPSATATIPVNMSMVRGHKYLSSAAEWGAGTANDTGFACLKLDMSASPQYFQYGYIATSTGFVATAHGDLNGDGQVSTFELKGQIVGNRLVVAPQILETDPKE